MPQASNENRTIDYYDQHAEEWAASHGGYEEKSWWAAEMARFHELLPNGKVLEIGAGAGKKLPEERKKVLEAAKMELKKLF